MNKQKPASLFKGAKLTLLLPLFIIGCSSNEVEADSEQAPKSTTPANQDKEERADWSNPVLILGSSFGEIINTYYRIGDLDKLYQFSDKESKSKYGKLTLIEKWKKLPLGIELRLLNKTEDDSIQWLHYETTVNATKKVLRVPVLIEDDTCRIVFDLFKIEVEAL